MSTPMNPPRRDQQPLQPQATTIDPAAAHAGASRGDTASADTWAGSTAQRGIQPRVAGARRVTRGDDTLEQPASGATATQQWAEPSAAGLGVDPDTVVAREKEQFGGIKIGSAFFGWVAAAGIAVLLTSLLTAAGVVLSLTSKTTAADVTHQASAGTGTAKTVGLAAAP